MENKHTKKQTLSKLVKYKKNLTMQTSCQKGKGSQDKNQNFKAKSKLYRK
jgi:hypothetical protein